MVSNIRACLIISSVVAVFSFILMSCIESPNEAVDPPSSMQSISEMEDKIYQEIIDMQNSRYSNLMKKASASLKKVAINDSSQFSEVEYMEEMKSRKAENLKILSANRADFTKCEGDSTKSEYMNFVILNEQLHAVPNLKSTLGIDEIKTCEEARTFTKKIYSILESRPSKEMEQNNEKMLESPLPKTNIKNGVDVNGPGLVKFENDGCTGVLLSPRVMATAGHCVDHMESRAYVMVSYFDPAYPTPSSRIIATQEMNIILYPDYTSGSDAANDLALIIKDSPWGAPIYGHDFRKIYVGTMANARYTNIYGQGYNSDAGTGNGIMRVGSEYVNWYGAHHFYAYANNSSNSMRLCNGDSGGPWTRKDFPGEAVSGISSNIGDFEPGKCVNSGEVMRACRLSGKVAWINQVLDLYDQLQCFSDGEYAQCYAGEENFALYRPTQVSSAYSSTYGGLKAVDGLYNSTTTKWNSAYLTPEPHWMIIDLQQSRTISSYLIRHAEVVEEGYPQYNTMQWAVYSSTDNVNWSYRDYVYGNTDKISYRQTLVPFNARYLYFHIYNAGEFYARIYEIEVY